MSFFDAQVKRLDSSSQVFASDESHGVIRFAISICSKCIDGNNAWMFQLACDLSFLHKPGLKRSKFRTVRPDLLQCHLSSKLLVFRDKDHTSANRGLMESELTDTDPLAGLNDLAKQVKAAGVTQVDGDVDECIRVRLVAPPSVDHCQQGPVGQYEQLTLIHVHHDSVSTGGRRRTSPRRKQDP